MGAGGGGGGCDWFTDWFTDLGLHLIRVCRMRSPDAKRKQRCNQQHEGADHRREKARAHWRVATCCGNSLGLQDDEKSAPAEGDWHGEVGYECAGCSRSTHFLARPSESTMAPTRFCSAVTNGPNSLPD